VPGQGSPNGHGASSARMVSAVDERAIELLRGRGWAPGAVLGAGMEGTVVDLSVELVAKVWHGRTREDLTALVEFGVALSQASVPFATPRVVDVLEGDDLVITIERKVQGESLRPGGTTPPATASAEVAQLLGDVLAGLSQAVVSPGLAVLPILPGEPSFEGSASFSSSLADLVDRRFRGCPDLLRREVADIDGLVAAVVDGLRNLTEPDPIGLIHGDLVPPNILVQNGGVSGVLDFGFMTTLGDPQFDAAITASIFDMYGPHARASEDILSREFLDRFGQHPQRYGLYRAAYAVITNAYFGTDGLDGHFAWCARMLTRPDIRAAVLEPI